MDELERKRREEELERQREEEALAHKRAMEELERKRREEELERKRYEEELEQLRQRDAMHNQSKHIQGDQRGHDIDDECDNLDSVTEGLNHTGIEISVSQFLDDRSQQFEQYQQVNTSRSNLQDLVQDAG